VQLASKGHTKLCIVGKDEDKLNKLITRCQVINSDFVITKILADVTVKEQCK
jgi:hypothetical protein